MATTSYDPLDRPLTVEYPGGEEVTYTYDREGPETLEIENYDLIDSMIYNEIGQLTGIVREVGPGSTFSYDGMTGSSGTGNNNGRLDTLQHGTTSDDFPDFTYEYDPVGNISEIYTEWT